MVSAHGQNGRPTWGEESKSFFLKIKLCSKPHCFPATGKQGHPCRTSTETIHLWLLLLYSHPPNQKLSINLMSLTVFTGTGETSQWVRTFAEQYERTWVQIPNTHARAIHSCNSSTVEERDREKSLEVAGHQLNFKFREKLCPNGISSIVTEQGSWCPLLA